MSAPEFPSIRAISRGGQTYMSSHDLWVWLDEISRHAAPLNRFGIEFTMQVLGLAFPEYFPESPEVPDTIEAAL